MPDRIKLLEESINNSGFFTLNKDSQYSLYKRELDKLLINLYEYEKIRSKHRDIFENEYGADVVIVFNDCIDAYDSSKGAFINYFNRSWKRHEDQCVGEYYFSEKTHGISIPDKEGILYSRIKKSLQNAIEQKIDTNSEEYIYNLAKELNISAKKAKTLIQLYSVSFVDNVVTDDEGEEIDIFEITVVPDEQEEKEQKKEVILDRLNHIDYCYSMVQERQKPLLSKLLTAEFLKLIIDVFNGYKNYSFIDIEVVKLYQFTGCVPTQKDIAEQFGRSEPSVSRTLKDFLCKTRVENI